MTQLNSTNQTQTSPQDIQKQEQNAYVVPDKQTVTDLQTGQHEQQVQYEQMRSVYQQIGLLNNGHKRMHTQDKHTSKSFENDLNEAIALFLDMGQQVAQQITEAIHALTDGNDERAQKVIQDDAITNQLERKIDEAIILLVAKRQPAAVDLRLVMAISKGVVDLERIGDEAVKIAQMARQLIQEGSSPRGYSEVQHLSNQVRLMLMEALSAFKIMDADQAFTVMQSDEAVNIEYQSATRSLMTYIMEDSRHVSKVINIMWVLRALERIGDHARNIAELIIYCSSGKDVRHTNFQQVEQVVQESNGHHVAQDDQTNE